MRKLAAADFRWSGRCWEATVQLACWDGYQSRRGPYGIRDTLEPSKGEVRFVFAPEGRGGSALEEAEIALMQWPLEHGPEMQQSLLHELVEHYAALRPRYARFLGADYESAMPSVQRAEEFHSLLGVHTIYVHQIQHAGLPYVGFAFGCTWDIEHGLGVLMHGSRVVEIGGEDTAFTGWRAEQDADSRGPKNVAPGSESMPESPRPSPNLPRWEVARQPSQKFDALSRDDGGKGPMNRLRAAHTWIGKGVAYLCLLAVVAFVLALLAALLFRWIRSW